MKHLMIYVYIIINFLHITYCTNNTESTRTSWFPILYNWLKIRHRGTCFNLIWEFIPVK